MQKKQKQFKPFVIPRFLPGQEAMDTVKTDLKIYNKHRLRVYSAQAKIDSSPPKMYPSRYINLRKFQDDAKRLKEIDVMNKRLVCRINFINRTQGVVDCWQKSPVVGFPKWLTRMTNANMIMKDNHQMYDRICNAQPHYSCKEQLDHFKILMQKMRRMAKYPFVLNQVVNLDEVGKLQLQLLGIPQFADRPKACLEFKFQMGQNLGKIVIETFIDYAPVCVNNFLELCKGKNNQCYKNCIIHNGRKGKYFDIGDVTRKSVYGSTYKTYSEIPILTHNIKGLVSMIPVKNELNCNEFSSAFSITMRPLPEFDNKRLVIGRIVKGLEVLEKIDDMLKRSGRPLEPIIITKCAVLPYLNKTEPEPPCND